VVFNVNLTMLLFLGLNGNKSHGTALAKCETINIVFIWFVFKWFLAGRITDLKITKTVSVIVAYCTKSNQLANQIVKKVIHKMRGDNAVTVLKTTENLLLMVTRI